MEISKEAAQAFVKEGFDRWYKKNVEDIKFHRKLDERDSHRYYVNAWARRAYVSDMQRDAIGRELNKLQQRIARQRKANRELINELKQKDELLREAGLYVHPE